MTVTRVTGDDHAERIARAIRARAASAGVKISELADSIEMKRSSFYKRLDGEIAWRLPELAAVALRLGTPIEDIITDAPFRPSELAANVVARAPSDRPGRKFRWTSGLANDGYESIDGTSNRQSA